MNEALFHVFYSWAHRSPFLDVIFSFFAKSLFLFLILWFVYLLFTEGNPRRRYHYLFLAVFAVLISWGIVSPLIHYAYPNPRPFAVLAEVRPLIAPLADSSFPSNHMMFMVPVALSAYYLNRKRGQWFLLAVFLMGIARIIAGVHWPLDILAGLVLGTLCFYLARYIISFAGLKDTR